MDYDRDMYNRSTFYKRQVDEILEVEKHKWFESEKAGHDIGGNAAMLDWMKKYRKTWNRDWNTQNKKSKDSID